MKKECNIIQDLLPNYLERLTKDETNNFIEEHIKNCNECKNIYEVMKDEGKTDKKESYQPINYMKKIKKHLSLLRTIILVIVIAFILIIGRKMLILQNLNAKYTASLEEIENNYYVKKITYSNGNIIMTESFNLNNDYLTITKSKNIEGNSIETIHYKKNDETITLFTDGESKIQSDEIVGGKILPSIGASSVYSAFVVTIDKVWINNEECYLIHYKNSDKYVDIDTGFTIREIDSNGTYTDYFYEFYKVNESNIVKPDLTGYENAEN